MLACRRLGAADVKGSELEVKKEEEGRWHVQHKCFGRGREAGCPWTIPGSMYLLWAMQPLLPGGTDGDALEVAAVLRREDGGRGRMASCCKCLTPCLKWQWRRQ